MLKQVRLQPANYYTSPGLSWDALLKKTGVELELLKDYDMHLFVERGMRGGISMVSTKRYARANNLLVEGYDPSKPNKHIMFLDANNLYSWAMVKPLPIKDFEWKRVMPTEEQIMNNSETQRIVQNAVAQKFDHIMIIWFILFLKHQTLVFSLQP